MFLNRFEAGQKRTCLISRPLTIAIEPTLKCNSDCLMCNRNFSRAGTKKAESFLSWETFNKVRPLFKYTRSVLFGGFGESLLHPEYIPMLREMKKDARFVFTYTNAILMNRQTGRELVDAGMDRICVSIGGASRETYRKIRGVDKFDTVVDNLRFIRDYKKKKGTAKPAVFLEVVAMNSVLHELPSLIELARELEAEAVNLTHVVVQGEKLRAESVWLNSAEAQATFEEAGKLADKQGIKFNPPSLDEKRRGSCSMLLDMMVVNWNGTMMSCPRERYIIGDLRSAHPADIWNSKGIMELRRELHENGLQSVCPRCSCWDNAPENFLDPPYNSREHATRL
jgi:radical SAM protein with 4Fe4S-binding SPASM domain